ncbi:unnamed protein product, partial [Cyprideis torosa]
EVIGKGSFGQVIRALDRKDGQQVAIKIIRNKKRFHHQALVEVKILDHLRKKDKDGLHHIIQMLEYFYFRNHLCITFELMGFAHQRVYTYIQSRFYRSPEVILGLPYGTPIDMWSLGCILAELYTGFPLFPGENEVEQLACIMEVIGLPPTNVVMSAPRRRLFFGEDRTDDLQQRSENLKPDNQSP